MTIFIDNEHTFIGIDGEILYLKFKEGIDIDLTIAIQSVTDRLLAQRGKPFLVLCDISGVHGVSRTARNYLSREGYTLIKALAVLAPSNLTTLLAQFSLTIAPPPFPAAIFQTENRAIEFLRSI